MNFSTSTKTFGNITSSSIYKGFKELKFAIWKNPQLAETILHSSSGNVSQDLVRQYTLTQASRYLGKSEAAFRLFLWENEITADGESNGTPLFSEDLLSLIESYGYLFDYSKKWRQTGHHAEADNLLKEAREIFGINSSAKAAPKAKAKRKEKKSLPIVPEYTEDWVSLYEESEPAPVYI